LEHVEWEVNGCSMMQHCIALPVSASPAQAGVASLRPAFGDVAMVGHDRYRPAARRCRSGSGQRLRVPNKVPARSLSVVSMDSVRVAMTAPNERWPSGSRSNTRPPVGSAGCASRTYRSSGTMPPTRSGVCRGRQPEGQRVNGHATARSKAVRVSSKTASRSTVRRVRTVSSPSPNDCRYSWAVAGASGGAPEAI
jgi:hypothetical protein